VVGDRRHLEIVGEDVAVEAELAAKAGPQMTLPELQHVGRHFGYSALQITCAMSMIIGTPCADFAKREEDRRIERQRKQLEDVMTLRRRVGSFQYWRSDRSVPWSGRTC